MMPIRHFLLVLALWLPFSQAAAAPPTGETMRIVVHLGALRDASRADVEASLKVWAGEVMRTVEVPAEISFFQTLPEVQREIASGRSNFVIADAVDLLRYFSADDLADGFGGAGRSEDCMVLLAGKDAAIRGVADLVGKRVVLLGDNAISDLWLETQCLGRFRKPCAEAGVSVVKEMRSRQQVHKVFFGTADAALVRGYAYELAQELNPQIRQRLRVVERIPIYPGSLGLFTTRVSQQFRDYVILKVPQMQNTARGRQILEVLQTDRVERFPKSVLEPIRLLMREHDALSARYGRHGAQR